MKKQKRVDFLAKIQQAEKKARAQRAGDKFRQKWHLMPPSGWMNDPNGLCYFKGKYHVFYQHHPMNPEGGGPISWGHFSSENWISWQQEEEAMLPIFPWDSQGVFSGSAIEKDGKLYLFYTGNVEHPGDYDYVYEGREHNVGVAILEDGVHIVGEKLILTNGEYPEDMSCHVRDPKVFQYMDRYYMVLGGRTVQDEGVVLLFESLDLMEWKNINRFTLPEDFGYMWECPDLFQIDGRWFLCFSPQGVPKDVHNYSNVYSCGYAPLYGDFRGEYSLGTYQEADFGFDYYAAQSFVTPDGRRVCYGWMGMPDTPYGNPTIEKGWNHCLTAPRQITLQNDKLCMYPIKELENLRDGEAQKLQEKQTIEETCFDIFLEKISHNMEFAIEGQMKLAWKNRILRLSFENNAGNGRDFREVKVDSLKNLRIMFDASSVEIYGNYGEVLMSSRCFISEKKVVRLKGAGQAYYYKLKSWGEIS